MEPSQAELSHTKLQRSPWGICPPPVSFSLSPAAKQQQHWMSNETHNAVQEGIVGFQREGGRRDEAEGRERASRERIARG